MIIKHWDYCVDVIFFITRHLETSKQSKEEFEIDVKWNETKQVKWLYLVPKNQSNNPTDELQNETESQHVKKLQGKSKQWISSETETH